MTNPWRLLSGDVQTDLQRTLVDPEVTSWFTGGNRNSVPKDIDGARSFGSWYDEFYRKSATDEVAVFPEWRFNHALTSAERNSLLCVYAKVKAEKLWEQIRTIHWVGATGEILFVPNQPSDALRQFLTTRGYGDWWMASHNCRWGLRSRFRGVQLHFRGPRDNPSKVNVHVDLNNPGDPTTPGAKPTNAIQELGQALRHSWRDDTNRGTTHTPSQLRAGLGSCGLSIVAVP